MTACCLSTLRDWGHTDGRQLAFLARGAGAIQWVERSVGPAGASLTQRPPLGHVPQCCPREPGKQGQQHSPLQASALRSPQDSLVGVLVPTHLLPQQQVSGPCPTKLLRPPASPGGKAGLVHEPQAPEASPNLLPALPCPLARPPCGLWRCHAHSWTWVLRPGLPPSLCHLPTHLTTLPCLLAPWTLQCPPPFAPSAWAAPSSPQAYPPPTTGAPAPGTSPAKPPPRLQVAPGLVGNRQRGPSSRSHPPSAGPRASSRPQIHTSEAGQPSTEGRAAPCPGSET
ncbi:unnamed protein product [Nyctereutes procyonoides]|uniref:(raccoon dog) hypothetical protein n=1 Tax=Nyctereutes procyonoides TaxID=34880 RepID=A0A811ZIJ2_NYCPR|nr:unnamed protein product [Nyctereutes procyonoides]